MSAWTCRHTDGKVVQKIVPPRPRIPYWKGLGADSEKKHEPVSDIDTVVVDSLKVLDPKWPIREADYSASPRALPNRRHPLCNPVQLCSHPRRPGWARYQQVGRYLPHGLVDAGH